MEDQMKEILDTVRFLKKDVVFLKDNMILKGDGVMKSDLAETEERLEKKIIFGVAEFFEHNISPQLDSMGKDIHLIKTALNGNTARY